MAFPCSCSRSGCANPHGRVEFNAARVRAHFIRTLLQLGLEQSAAAEYDGALPPPAKRCCIDDGQPQMSLSSSFSSSPSFFVNSSCVDSASVSTANGFEPQTVYLDSVEGLSGPDTMVVAYDEDYGEADCDSSSETSSDGASFDGVSDDVDDGRTAEMIHDSRQRTLDDYVVRFSREHMYTGAGPSNCSTMRFAGGFQMSTATNPSISAPLSCAVACQSSTLQCSVADLRAETVPADHLLHDSAYLYCLASDTRHDTSLPYEHTNSHSQPETIISDKYFATGDNTHNTADNISCHHSVSDDNIGSCFTEQEAAVSCSAPCTAGSGYTVTCCLPSSLTRGTTYNCCTRGNVEHSYDATCSCCTAENKSDCIRPENSSQGLCVSDVADSKSSQHNATHFYSVVDNAMNSVGDSKLSSTTTDADETSHCNLVPENSRNDCHVSSNIVDNTQDCPTQQETSGSSLDDNAHGYTTSNDTVPCVYCTTDNSTCTAPQVIVCDHSTMDDTGFSKTGSCVHGHATDNVAQNITHCHSVQIDAKHEYFFPDYVSHSCCIQDNTVHDSSKTAHNYCVPYDSTHGSCSHADSTEGCTMPDNTDVSIVTEDNTAEDSHTDNTLHGYTVSDDTSTVDSHCPVSDTTTFSYLPANTDDITYSCSASEIVINDSSNADSCVMTDDPSRGSSVPENSGNSYCTPDDNTNSCPLQSSARAGCIMHLESDDIAVTAVGEACQPVQNDCGHPCPLIETYGNEITTRNETVPDMSEMLDDASCVMGTASGDLSIEHSTLPETITRSQPCSVMTASSNHVNSVAESGESVKSDDIPTTQDFSYHVVCSALDSFSGTETETPTSSSY